MKVLFEETTREIFEQADVDPEKNPELFNECMVVLNQKMAMLSATMGMSMERVNLFNKQKKTLVADLKKMKAKGQLKT